jgi:hypothetical protein
VSDELQNKTQKDNSINKNKSETIYQAALNSMGEDDEWLCVVSQHGRLPIQKTSKRLDARKKKQKKPSIEIEFDR